jgi:hypothetical protein
MIGRRPRAADARNEFAQRLHNTRDVCCFEWFDLFCHVRYGLL